MIATDCQPYSIVEDTGFNRLVMTLEPKNAETLLFIKNNFQLLNGQYSY